VFGKTFCVRKEVPCRFVAEKKRRWEDKKRVLAWVCGSRRDERRETSEAWGRGEESFFASEQTELGHEREKRKKAEKEKKKKDPT
jgi:hypothetical protein